MKNFLMWLFKPLIDRYKKRLEKKIIEDKVKESVNK